MTDPARPPLTAVPDPFNPPVELSERREASQQSSEIPDFEGKPVAMTVAKMTGAGRVIDIDDRVLRMDDIVEMHVQGRIQGVRHVVGNGGKLVRVHEITVIDGEFHRAWDASGTER